MTKKNIRIAALGSLVIMLAMTSFSAMAADKVLHLDVKDVLAADYSAGKLDGTVKFYFAGQSTPAILKKMEEDTTNKKTNGVGKTHVTSCKWAMLSALIALQESAKSRGANAVIGISSYYKKVEYKSATQYECHVGNIMTGVALKGSYAKLAGK